MNNLPAQTSGFFCLDRGHGHDRAGPMDKNATREKTTNGGPSSGRDIQRDLWSLNQALADFFIGDSLMACVGNLLRSSTSPTSREYAIHLRSRVGGVGCNAEDAQCWTRTSI